MDILVRNYLEAEYQRLLRKDLTRVAGEIRELNKELRPILDERRRQDRERRSKGDGFVITGSKQ